MTKRAIQELTVWFIVMALALWLIAGCTPHTRDRIVTVSQPVRVDCALPRPVGVPTLKERYPDWDAMDVRQKAAAVGKQALDLRTYGEQLGAATGGC